MRATTNRSSLFNLKSHKKLIINSVLIVFFTFLLVYFIENQGAELLQVKEVILNSSPFWIGVGFLCSFLYVIIQGLIFQFSFSALSTRVKLVSTILLYLKRNIISIFLPGGTFASLAFFTKPIEDQGVGKTKIYFATYIFGITALLAIAVISVPVLVYLLVINVAATQVLLSFGFLLVFLSAIVFIFRSFTRKGTLYRGIIKYLPELKIVLDDLGHQKIKKRYWVLTVGVASLIDILGMIVLFASMMAIGYRPTLEIVIVGYVVIGLLLISSPFMKGIGVVEFALTFFLTQYGFTTIQAISITALFRFFEFWLPVGYSLLSFIYSRNNLIQRILPAVTIFFLGLINIVSSITVNIPEQLAELSLIMPISGEDVSRYFQIVFGVLYIVVATFLFRGSKNAWYLTMVLLLFSLVGAIFFSSNTIKLFGLLVIASFLIITRKQYYLQSAFSFSWSKIRIAFMAILISVLYAALVLFYSQGSLFDIEITLVTAFKYALSQLLLMNYGFLHPTSQFAEYIIYSMYMLGSGILVYSLFGILRPSLQKKLTTQADLKYAAELVVENASSPLDNYKVYPDKTLYFDRSVSGFISYRTADNIAVVLGSPVVVGGVSIKGIVQSFDKYCRHHNMISAYYLVPEVFIGSFHDIGKKSFAISEQIYIDEEDVSLSFVEEKIDSIKQEHDIQSEIFNPSYAKEIIAELQNIATAHEINTGESERLFDNDIFLSDKISNQRVLVLKNNLGKFLAFLSILENPVNHSLAIDIIRMSSKEISLFSAELLILLALKFMKENHFSSIIIGNQTVKNDSTTASIYERIISMTSDSLQRNDFSRSFVASIQYLKPKSRLLYLVYTNTYDLLRIPATISKISKHK